MAPTTRLGIDDGSIPRPLRRSFRSPEPNHSPLRAVAPPFRRRYWSTERAFFARSGSALAAEGPPELEQMAGGAGNGAVEQTIDGGFCLRSTREVVHLGSDGS